MGTVQVMYGDHHPSYGHLDRLNSLLPHHRITVVESADQAIAEADDTVVVLGHRFLRQVLSHTHRLRWVQASSSGFDHLPYEEVGAKGAILTTAGFAGPVIAQHATMLALAMNRQLRESISRQDSQHWGNDLYDELPPRIRTAIVLGLGEIGGRVASMLAMGDIEVWGVSRTPIEVAGVTRYYTDDTWKQVVHEIDLLIVCLPLSRQTEALVDSITVDRLKPTAYVVNVGRSETVDLGALVRRLKAGTLGGVAIDVTPGRLPLPEDSALWQVPGLIITPYLAARYGDRGRDLESYVESQVKRWANHEPLRGVVSLRGG